MPFKSGLMGLELLLETLIRLGRLMFKGLRTLKDFFERRTRQKDFISPYFSNCLQSMSLKHYKLSWILLRNKSKKIQIFFSSDEEDLRAEQLLLKDKWRAIFDQFDPEGFGEIPWSEFLVVMNQEEFKSQVPEEKIDSLIELAYKWVKIATKLHHLRLQQDSQSITLSTSSA